MTTRVTNALIQELRANGTLHHVADHLAQDLLEEREVHERVTKAFLNLRQEILGFMTKHHIPASARELMASQTGTTDSDGRERILTSKTHGPTDPANIGASIIWLRDILKWAEERDGLAIAYESPDSERWP